MKNPTQIYVGLADEDVQAWRPVLAEHIQGNNYRILSQPYDRAIERWKFEPNDEVVCELVESNDGRILAATRKV